MSEEKRREQIARRWSMWLLKLEACGWSPSLPHRLLCGNPTARDWLGLALSLRHHQVRRRHRTLLRLSLLPAPSPMSAPSVPLSRKTATKVTNGANPPIWAVTHSTTSTQDLDAPLPAKCARHDRDGVCCKELKGEDERHLIDPDVIRDA